MASLAWESDEKVVANSTGDGVTWGVDGVVLRLYQEMMGLVPLLAPYRRQLGTRGYPYFHDEVKMRRLFKPAARAEVVQREDVTCQIHLIPKNVRCRTFISPSAVSRKVSLEIVSRTRMTSS